LQATVGSFLKENFPREIILEEFIIPNSKLSVDFFLPNLKMVIEINGEQHYQYTPFFHDQELKHNFAKQKHRDVSKHKWAEINGYKYISIRSTNDLELLNVK